MATNTEILDIRTEADLSQLDKSVDAMGKASDSMDEVGQSAEKISEGSDKASSGLGSFISFISSATGVLGGLTASLGLAATLLSGVGEANAWNSAMNQMQARTGATNVALAEYRDIGQDIYNSGLGEGVEDVVDSMSTVRNITQASGDELENLTEDAMTLRDVFDYEVGESVRAADTAMNAFGADGSHVFDLITATAQKTGDPMGDLLDTVNEYSPVFAAAGYSVDQMFEAIVQGSDNGAFSLDKVGDLIKEFNIRMLEGSDEAKGAWDQLFNMNPDGFRFIDYEKGIDTTIDSTKELFDAVAAGEIPISIVGDRLSGMLEDIEDPVLRQQIGVALMGSQWEDLGASAIGALDIMDEGMEGVEGATDAAQAAMQQGMGPAIERMKRIGMTLLANFLTPYIVALADKAVPAMERFGVWMQTKGVVYLRDFGEALGTGIDYIEALSNIIINALGGKETVFAAIADGASGAAGVIGNIADAVGGLSPESILLIAGALLIMAGPAIIAGLVAIGGIMLGIAASAMATMVAFAPLLIVLALVAAYESNFGGLKTAIDSVGTAIAAGDIEGAFRGIANALLAIPMGIADELGKIVGLDVQGGLAAWSGVGDQLKTIAENGDKIPGALNNAQKSVTGVDLGAGLSAWGGVADMLGILYNNASNIPWALEGLVQSVTGVDLSGGLSAWGGVADMLGILYNNASNIPWALEGLVQSITGVDLSGGLSAWGGVADMLGTLYNNASNIPWAILGIVSSLITMVVPQSLIDLVTKSDLFKAAISAVPAALEAFKSALSNFQVPSWVQNLANDLKSLLASIEQASSVLGGGGVGGFVSGVGDALGIGGNADGGLLGSGDWSWVGERGPELFRAPTAGRIIANHQLGSVMSASAGGSAGGGDVVVRVPITLELDGSVIYENQSEHRRRREP